MDQDTSNIATSSINIDGGGKSHEMKNYKTEGVRKRKLYRIKKFENGEASTERPHIQKQNISQEKDSDHSSSLPKESMMIVLQIPPKELAKLKHRRKPKGT